MSVAGDTAIGQRANNPFLVAECLLKILHGRRRVGCCRQPPSVTAVNRLVEIDDFECRFCIFYEKGE